MKALVMKFKKLMMPKSASQYRSSINVPSRALLNGDFNMVQFMEAFDSAIDRGFERAWREGAARCGIAPDERTEEESKILAENIAAEKTYTFNLGEWIQADEDRTWGQVSDRLFMWENSYLRIVEQAQQMSCSDKKGKWKVGDTEHCEDCRRMNGRVYRMSVWEKWGILPKARNLACGGWRCECFIEITDDPITPGRPPGLTGNKQLDKRSHYGESE